MCIGSIGIESIWIVIPTVMYTLIGQDFPQRMFASKDENTARNSSLASGILLAILAVFPVLAGMAATLKYPALQNARAAIMAAVMSAADSLLCAGTSHVITHLYISAFKSKADTEQEVLYWSMIITSIITVVLGILALLIALSVPGILEIFDALASLVVFVVVSLLTKPAAMPQPKAPAA